MVDAAAIKSRLSDPREVARLLGLRIEGPQRRGVLTRCPVHNNHSGSLSLRVGADGTLAVKCHGCNVKGDIFALVAAIEGLNPASDFKRIGARAQELAGGAVGAAADTFEEAPRCEPNAYHALAERILVAGRLDGRRWTRDVEEYLERRGLLDLARADGWAALPNLGWLIELAKEVCDGVSAGGSGALRSGVAEVDRVAHGQRANTPGGRSAMGIPQRGRPTEPQHDHEAPGATRFSSTDIYYERPHDLLVAARLARWHEGRLRAVWGGHRLVIPWRGPDGRINALQRRRVVDGAGPKYVLPWAPEWPYGSERIGCGDGLSSEGVESNGNDVGGRSGATVRKSEDAGVPSGSLLVRARGLGGVSFCRAPRRVAIVEGAPDTLAMRALHPAFVALGIPGIGGWQASWAKLLDKAEIRIALDRGKPGKDGVIPEDRAAARIALDCVGAGSVTDRVLEWLGRRHAEGKGLFCVLCGAPEPWLCRGCGRRRAPEGMDWGNVWELKQRTLRAR